jgi:pimeloyl-ACP methyl ester carboxylesterase
MSNAAPRTFTVPSSSDRPGPTFLLLHGIGLSHREYTGLARHLSRRGRVVAFDLPGFGALGRTRNPASGRLSVEQYAEIVRRAVERMGIGPVVVVGHSMGAQFAVEFAKQSPESVSHVVLVGPVVDARKPTLTAQALALALDAVLEPPATQLMVAVNYVRSSIPWFLTEAVAMRDYKIDHGIVDVPHPVLVVRGQDDPIADARWCMSLSELARDGRVATIPGFRHNVVHSNPAASAAAILAFVDATPA